MLDRLKAKESSPIASVLRIDRPMVFLCVARACRACLSVLFMIPAGSLVIVVCRVMFVFVFVVFFVFACLFVCLFVACVSCWLVGWLVSWLLCRLVGLSVGLSVG